MHFQLAFESQQHTIAFVGYGPPLLGVDGMPKNNIGKVALLT